MTAGSAAQCAVAGGVGAWVRDAGRASPRGGRGRRSECGWERGERALGGARPAPRPAARACADRPASVVCTRHRVPRGCPVPPAPFVHHHHRRGTLVRPTSPHPPGKRPTLPAHHADKLKHQQRKERGRGRGWRGGRRETQQRPLCSCKPCRGRGRCGGRRDSAATTSDKRTKNKNGSRPTDVAAAATAAVFFNTSHGTGRGAAGASRRIQSL